MALAVVTGTALAGARGAALGGGSFDAWSYNLGGLVGIIALYCFEYDAWPWR